MIRAEATRERRPPSKFLIKCRQPAFICQGGSRFFKIFLFAQSVYEFGEPRVEKTNSENLLLLIVITGGVLLSEQQVRNCSLW